MDSPERSPRSVSGTAKGTRDATERSSLPSRIDQLEARVTKLEKDAIANTTEGQRLLSAIGQIQSELSSYKIEDMEDWVTHVIARPNLLSLLSEAANELQTRFHSEHLLLQTTDERFLLVVETDLEVEDAERRFSSFLREWWNKKIELEDRMSINLRYV